MDKLYRRKFARELKKYRQKRKLSFYQMSFVLFGHGNRRSSLWSWENEKSSISFDEAERIARFLNLRISWKVVDFKKEEREQLKQQNNEQQ